MNLKNKIIVPLIFAVVMILSIGFSAFNTELSITGTVATVRPNLQIRITSLAVEEIYSNAETIYTDYNKDRMLVGIKLPNKDSYVKYKVEITNIGDVEMGITNFLNLPSDLTYTLDGYTLKDKLCNNNNECSLGITKEFYITIKYKDTSSISTNIYDINLIFNFNRYYNVSYSNIKTLSSVCVPSTTLTTGTYATTNYNPGEEYTCEVKDGVFYTFFVLSTEGDKVNFILDRSIASDGSLANTYIPNYAPVNGVYNTEYWISDLDYGCGSNGAYCAQNSKGPITAINYVTSATSSWSNIENLNETYTDEGSVYGTIQLTGKARLPKLSEIENTKVGCSTTAKSCPLWLVNYLADTVAYDGRTGVPYLYGYWMLPTKGSTIYSWAVGASGDIGGSTIYYGYSHSIRPVISVSKTTPENSGYQTTVIGDDTLKIDFDADAPASVQVKMNGVYITDYEYSDGVLTIPNVMGNIEVVGN